MSDAQDYKDYQDYLEYQKHVSAPPPAASMDPQGRPQPGGAEPSLQGGGVRSAMDVASPGFNRGALEGLVKQGSLGNANIDTPSSSPAGQMAGSGAAIAAQGALAGGPVAAADGVLAKTGLSALLGAAQGAAQKPAGDDTLQNRAIGGGVGAAVGGVGQLLGSAAGKVGDYAMQRAANIKNMVPGLGNKLADMGVWGTKGMMQGQVNSGIQDAENSLQQGVSKMSGEIPSQDTSDALRAKAAPYMQGTVGASGPFPVPSENAPFVNSALSRADEAAGRGNMAPQDALSLSRAIAKPAYNKMGDPLSAFKHQLSQTEAGSIKGALKDAADAQGIPDVRNALADQTALYQAKNGLDKNDGALITALKGVGKAGVTGALGYGLGGVPGAIAGAAAQTNLGQSTVGQAGNAAGKAAPYITPALLDMLMSAQRGGVK